MRRRRRPCQKTRQQDGFLSKYIFVDVSMRADIFRLVVKCLEFDDIILKVETFSVVKKHSGGDRNNQKMFIW